MKPHRSTKKTTGTPRHFRQRLRVWCALTASLLIASCTLQPADYGEGDGPTADGDRLIVLCEGLWATDNSQANGSASRTPDNTSATPATT